MIRELIALTEVGITNADRDADGGLVTRLRAGDEEAFEILMERYQAALFRYVRSFVGDSEQARDLVQDTFLRAYKSIDNLDDPLMLRSWLYRIAHNLACSLLRRQRLIDWLPLSFEHRSHMPAPDRHAIEVAHIDEALAQVPIEQRAPLLLHLVAGFSYSEIATLLHISEGAVRMRISRGRATFREAYGFEEDDDAS